MTRRPLALLAVGIGLGALAGCAPAGTVAVEPAANASDPACASVVLNLPQEVAAEDEPLPKRVTSAQATGAWGVPAAVVMRCGVPEPAPSTDTCLPVDDVDWINVHSDDETSTFVTYGRTPAVEVTLDASRVAGLSALEAITPALRATEQYAQCL